jgi:hypothetical protein
MAAQAPIPAVPQPNPVVRYCASIYPGPKTPLPQPFVDAVKGLEESLNMPVWMLLHGNDGQWEEIDGALRDSFFEARSEMPTTGQIALLIDSPGGQAKCAYQIATLFRRHCKGFTAVIPRRAKSAATLLVLGASGIILNKYAELGPLDAQVFDRDREEWASALDEVQALERLHAFGLEAIDQTMLFLFTRTRKKIETILPHTLNFVGQIMGPMLDKVDVIHYTQRARQLKVAEEYAIRLLKPKYNDTQARKMARHLVEKYPEHDFAIDVDELTEIGVQSTNPSTEQVELMDTIIDYIGEGDYIGRLVEAPAP